MKNHIIKFVLSLLAFMVLALVAANTALKEYGISPMVTIGVLFAVTLLIALFETSSINGVYRADTVNVTMWQKFLVNRFFKQNPHLTRCVRADEYVIANTAVVIPQIGNAPTVVKNNTVFPLVAVQRADSAISYLLDIYVTTPSFVTLDEIEAISYNKKESIYNDHFKVLMQTCADDVVIKWANGLPGATNVVFTTGAATNMLEIGQTGSRNKATVHDVKNLSRMMNKDNVDPMGRCLLMEANMLDQFTDDLSITDKRDFSQTYDPKTGVVGRMFGFDIMTRSSVIQAAAAYSGGNLSVNALGAAIGATDNVGCLAWQENSLELAMGQVHIFNRENDPLYTGDINNCRIKAGNRVRRADYKGVYALMQGTPVA